jgi:tetratricopeptide (TPR) repeat protein
VSPIPSHRSPDLPRRARKHATASSARALGATLSVLLVGGAAHVAAGQPSPSETDAAVEELSTVLAQRIDRDAESARLAAKAREAFATRDLDAAMAALRAQIEIDGENFVVHYNLACARAAMGKLDDANADLRRAIELGFANRGHLERDPYLEPLRETEQFREVIEHWGRIIDAQRRIRFEQTEKWVRGKTEIRENDPLRIDVISAHDDRRDRSGDGGDREGRGVVGRPASQWGMMSVWTGPRSWCSRCPISATSSIGRSGRTAIARGGPSRASAVRTSTTRNGLSPRTSARPSGTSSSTSCTGGRWTGSGRSHPIWIQEGLASLVEDFDPAPASPAGIEPVASWRTNIVKRLGKANRLPGLDELAGLTHTRFSTSRPLARYAQARTLFLFLHDRDELAQWLGTYTGSAQHGFDADPSGLSAFDTVVGLERDRGERAYRAWVSTRLPEVAEEPTDVRAQLGVGLEPGDGDGPRVKVLPRGARRATGLRLGDVVTSVDSRATRSTQEYLRVISAYSPGQTVKVTYRRGKLHGETEITLIPVP